MLSFLLIPLLLVTTTASVLSRSSTPLDSTLGAISKPNFLIEDLLTLPGRPRSCPADRRGTSRKQLAYVTPWNPAGYAYTELHAERLTHVVPVWYQVTLSHGKAKVEGHDAYQKDWHDALRGSGTKIVPRFELKFARKEDIEALLFFPRDEEKNIVSAILKEVKAHQYDGVTLETPYVSQMTQIIRRLGKALHRQSKELVLVVPVRHAIGQEPPLTAQHLETLSKDVDLFSLNTYDHASSLGKEVGNAPTYWLREVLNDLLAQEDDDDFDEVSSESSSQEKHLRSKVLLGLNFYGHTMTKDSVLNTITAKEYTGLLEFSLVSMPLQVTWDPEAAEHRLESALWNIWFPSALSILHRLNLADEYGIGIAIWEAGQGLEHFWDLI